jgi:diphosphomevalonate decarboxylase
MASLTATSIAHPNIAFIKYWGNQNDALRLASNGSISMDLAELQTRTRVEYIPGLVVDELFLNNEPAKPEQVIRVSQFLDIIRSQAGLTTKARVISENNFPSGTGIASSASAFAALALAGSKAAGLDLDQNALSRLSRRGSGSACRSIPTGFVEWYAGETDQSSYAESILEPSAWDIVDLVAVLDATHKKVGSTAGHGLAGTSPLQAGRVGDTPRRLAICRQAIQDQNIIQLIEIIEQDALIMHSVMMTSTPPLFYIQPATLQLMELITTWRGHGVMAGYTMDAGPNVHIITTSAFVDSIRSELHRLSYVQNLFIAHPGEGASIISE